MKKLILLCSTAVVMPTAAFAQSTGTVTTEEEKEIVVTATRVNNGVDGIVVPDTTKAKGVLTQELIKTQAPGQTILNAINLIPSVNFTNSDPYGSSGGNIRIRGFDGNRISLTFDGVPLNDSGNYAIFSNQQLDPELIEQVNVGLGVTDVDSPTASAAGGTVNYRTMIPTDKFGVRAAGSIGDFNYNRVFMMVNTGRLTSFGTKAWLSASRARNDKFKGPGEIDKQQYNVRVYQPIGSGGDFISIAGHYNKNRNNFYRNPSITDLRGALGSTLVPSATSTFPTADDPLVIGGYEDPSWDTINDLENLGVCTRTVARAGVRQDDNGGTGPNGTGAAAPAVLGSGNNNVANTSSCTNFYNLRINPSNTGNIRGQSRFTLTDDLIFTFDPSFQYVLANGGGTTAFNENDRQLRGSRFATVGGIDLNGDGDFLDRIRLYTPNNTNTRRYGLTSSLIYDISAAHRVRVAYTYDRARHRQTGEWGYLDQTGAPESVFGGRNASPVLDANGNPLQQRDRLSIALLHQISGQYIGRFFDNALRVEVGVRRPFFTRELTQNCYTFASGNGFAYCSSEVLGTTPIPSASGNYIVPADFQPAVGATVPSNAVYAPFEAKYKFGKILPNVGFTYKVSGPISVFGSYAKGFSAPRTDNLYRRPQVDVTPEETNAFDLGVRYTNRTVQAQATAWKIDYKNRIVSSFNPDLGISLDRNVGKVESWGIDGSIAYQPIPQVSFLVLASYIKAELQQNVEIGSVTYNGVTSPVLPVNTVLCAPLPTGGTFPRPVTTCAPTAGKMVAETPKFQYGGRANFDFKPVSIGIQAKRVGKRYATDTNDVVVKGYVNVDLDARLDLAWLSPELSKTYLQFNLINVLKTKYFGNISTQINAAGNPNFAVGSPRTFLGTLNIGF